MISLSKTMPLIFLALASLVIALSVDAKAQGVPIVVANPDAVPRVGDLVRTGVAVPAAVNLYDTTTLTLVDDAGQDVPVQFRVLSRWHGDRNDMSKRIKWALIEFVDDLAAQETRTWMVQPGTPIPGALSVTTTPTTYLIDTGAAIFTIARQSVTVLDQVTTGGVARLASPVGLDLRQPSGTSAPLTFVDTVIEESGTVAMVVRKRITASTLGLDLTVRLRFHSSSPEVVCDVRLENNGAFGEIANMGPVAETAWLKRLSLDLRPFGGVTSATTPSGARSIAAQTWALEQAFGMPTVPLDMLSAFTWVEKIGSTVVATGQRHEGVVQVSGPSASIRAVVDRFWQQKPKALRADALGLSIDLFPEFGNGPTFGGQYSTPTNPGVIAPQSLVDYRIDGGRWKTHTVHLRFGAAETASTTTLTQWAAGRSLPLLARTADLAWSFRELNFGQMLVERRPVQSTGAQRYDRMLQVMADDSAADFQPSLGQIGLPAFRNRGGTYGGGDFWGWDNWGDLVWGDGYASLHYDLVYGVLVNWYRTGDRRFVDIGRDMAAHRRDYDQYHSRHPLDPARGGQWYEKGWFHGNFTAPTPSHTWVHGLLLWYVLSGDEGAREAAVEVGDFIVRHHPETWDGFWGARILGWQLEALVDLYNYLGDPAYLSLAQQTAQRWITLEQQNGGGGFVLNPGWTNPGPHAQVWMQMIVFNALAKYFFASSDTSVLPVMGRMADWYLSECIAVDPVGPATATPIGKVWGRVSPTMHTEPSVHHCWVAIEALTNAAVCLWRTDCYQQALRLFGTTSRFHQVSAAITALQDLTNVSTFSPIAFRMMQYPDSESKIYGNLARWGHAFMALQAALP